MNLWIEAARPRTLVAGIVPVVVGTAAADAFIAWRFAAALTVGIAIQVGVNYANDLFDAQRGVDTRARVGPRRATAAGLVSAGQMRTAMSLAFGVAALAGVALAVFVGLELLVVGVLCFLAALGYSGGPFPYGARALGEVFVFVFFGLVATVGSAYVQVERIPVEAVLAAAPVGLLASAILVVNNLRDVETDRTSGKITLAVKLGPARTRWLFAALVAIACAWPFLMATVIDGFWMVAVFPAGFAAAGWIVVREVWRAEEPSHLIDALQGAALLLLAYGGSLAGALWLT
ncbi:MAG: 1,4-dihydroxy-2-naphthoate polyprenyltransferase [Actinomycetota bacterium]